MKRPRVLVSILNWNDEESTLACISSVEKQIYDNHDIILIDNASKVRLKSLEALKKRVKVIQNSKNLGYAGGHAVAADYAMINNYDLLWILNNDTIVHKKSLQAIVEKWQNNPMAIYGSLILENDNSTIRFAGGYPVQNCRIIFSKKYNPLKGSALSKIDSALIPSVTSEVNGASIFIPVELIRDFGFIPDYYFLYAEETHYCYYLRQYNIPSIIVKESIVSHAGSKSFNNSSLDSVALYYRLRNDLLLKKNFGLISNFEILKGKFSLNYWFPFLARSIALKLGFKNKKLRYYLQQLAIWHAIINQKGKTIIPDHFLYE